VQSEIDVGWLRGYYLNETTNGKLADNFHIAIYFVGIQNRSQDNERYYKVDIAVPGGTAAIQEVSPPVRIFAIFDQDEQIITENQLLIADDAARVHRQNLNRLEFNIKGTKEAYGVTLLDKINAPIKEVLSCGFSWGGTDLHVRTILE